MSDAVLKCGILKKRPIGKSLIKNFNLKERVFVLTKDELRYYDGSIEKRGKLKGSVDIAHVKAVEKVRNKTFERPHSFQVILNAYQLYMFADSEEGCKQWIDAIRKVLARDLLWRKFHPGAFLSGTWSCCNEKHRASVGCESTFICINNGDTDQGSPSFPATDKSFKVSAKFDFKPVHGKDLELIKDREYEILDDASDKNWWYARDCLGREGYVPSNYVVRQLGIECEKWYHKDMSRQEADEILKKSPDGTFIVRDSRQPGLYTLSFSFQSDVKHYHIKKDDDGSHYVSQRHRFATIPELIKYHKLNAAGLVTRLRNPYTGIDGQAPVTIGHGVFHINAEELEILGKIGQGQFGTVHEAMWKGRDKVAVKMMKEGTMDSQDFIEEAKIMQRFDHRNLVSLYGVSYGPNGSLRIVVELLPNGALLQFLRKNKSLLNDVPKLMGIVYQVSSAMSYLESEKFIHRDLAARNCLVGYNNIIKVSDFGLTRYVVDDEYTASEGTKFPIRWAAPEVIEYGKFSSKSDVWAFGVLCWEVFSGGLLPYHHVKNNFQIVKDMRAGVILDRPPVCPKEMYKLMKCCWTQNAEVRPTFKEIRSVLASLTEDYD